MFQVKAHGPAFNQDPTLLANHSGGDCMFTPFNSLQRLLKGICRRSLHPAVEQKLYPVIHGSFEIRLERQNDLDISLVVTDVFFGSRFNDREFVIAVKCGPAGCAWWWRRQYLTTRLRWRPIRKRNDICTSMRLVGVMHTPVSCDPPVDVMSAGRDKAYCKHQEGDKSHSLILSLCLYMYIYKRRLRLAIQ